MSTFAVTRQRVRTVEPAENSDFLDLVRLENVNFSFITARGLYNPGDEVIYFPVDSLLPMWIVDMLNLTGKLAHGKQVDGGERLQNRVKTIRLRGNYSQGVVCVVQDLVYGNEKLTVEDFDGYDFTELLGVEKYEPPIVPSKHGNLLPLPKLVDKYDIEGTQNFPAITEILMNVPCYITEKLEGSNWWASIDRNGEIIVGQRNYRIEEKEDGEHDWWKAFRAVPKFKEALREVQRQTNAHRVTLRGEIVGPGIQGNYYGLSDFAIYLFEIEVDGVPLPAQAFMNYTEYFNLTTVPTLAFNTTLRAWINGNGAKDVLAASDGKSLVNPKKLREGVVIKPMRELTNDEIGRVFLKQRSPKYLSKTDF